MVMTQERAKKSRAVPGKPAGGALNAESTTRRKGESQAAPAAVIDARTRELLVSRIAYFRAEKRGFVPGMDQQDWFEAEAEAEILLFAETR